MKKNKTGFLIPSGTIKILGDFGWEFKTSSRIPLKVKESLIKKLKLNFLESYLGIDSYINDDIKMSVLFDGDNQIENIYFQFDLGVLTTLVEVCQSDNECNKIELFLP